MFESIKKAMKEWSEIFQPMYNDITEWKDFQDIGKFKPSTLQEIREAWGTIPKPHQKDLYKAYKLLIKYVKVDIIIKMFKIYLEGLNRDA